MKRSKQRWLWFLLAIFISTGTYFTIRYGLRPKPIPVMNATTFENLEQIGAVTYRRLRQDVRGERLILLGSSPDLSTYREVWKGFLKTAAADHLKIDVIFQSEELVGLDFVDGWEVVPVSAASLQSGEFIGQVKSHLQAGHFVVIHAPTVMTSHLMKNALSAQLDPVAQHPILALSTVALNFSEQESYQEQCAKSAPEGDFAKRISCAQVRMSKVLAKKMKNAPHKIWSIIERHGLKEYLIFVRD